MYHFRFSFEARPSEAHSQHYLTPLTINVLIIATMNSLDVHSSVMSIIYMLIIASGRHSGMLSQLRGKNLATATYNVVDQLCAIKFCRFSLTF